MRKEIFMSVVFEDWLIRAIDDPGTVKIVATSDGKGTPHLQESTLLHVAEDGYLVLPELHEHSLTNRNLVRAIWFGGEVTIFVRTSDRRSFQITGSPYKALVSGARYEHYYRLLREKGEDVDLSTVWLIEARGLTDESAESLRHREEQTFLPLIHLDRIARA
jgi:hypothetical protein